MRWCSYMVSCPERDAVRAATLGNLARSDWGEAPDVVLDQGAGPPSLARIMATWTRALERAAKCMGDAVLLLEDDLRFSPTLRRDVESWPPFIRRGDLFLGTLYNVQTAWTQAQTGQALKEFCYGAQAIVTTPATVRAILSIWTDPRFAWPYPDERLFRIAGTMTPIHVHTPSLVQHVGASTWNPIRALIPYPTGT